MINPSVSFPTRTSPPSSGMPYGSARDATTANDPAATPYNALILNDIWGLMQAVADAGGVTPSGSAEAVGASQLLPLLQSAGGTLAGAVLASSPEALSIGQIGKTLLAGTGVTSVTLPAAAASITGGVFRIFTSAGTTLQVSGGAAFQVGNASVTSLQLQAGTYVEAICAGDTWWVFGTGTLAKSASFASSLASPGYQYLPSGLIIQIGVVPTAGSANFPIPFPNACLSVGISYYNSTGGSGAAWAQMNVTTTNSTISGQAQADQFRYIAIGW